MEKYPAISLTELQKLNTILTNAGADPDYLKNKSCPYDKNTVGLLEDLLPDPVVLATLDSKPDGRKKPWANTQKTMISPDKLSKELEGIQTDLRDLKKDGKGLDPGDQIQIIKTRAVLLEKLLTVAERIDNLEKQKNFIATVIQRLEDECPQEARLRIIDKLEPYALGE